MLIIVLLLADFARGFVVINRTHLPDEIGVLEMYNVAKGVDPAANGRGNECVVFFKQGEDAKGFWFVAPTLSIQSLCLASDVSPLIPSI